MSYVSPLDGDQIVTMQNWRDFARPQSGDLCSGYVPRSWVDQPLGSSPYAGRMPKELVIPEADWPEWIERKDREQSWLTDIASDMGNIWWNQDPSWYCWCYCVVQGCQLSLGLRGERTRRLVPESVAGPIMNYRKQGGWPLQAVEYIAEHGVADDSVWLGATHAQRNNSRYFAGSRENAALTRLKEWWDVADYAELVSLLLRNFPVPLGYGWMGHAMLAARVVLLKNGDTAIKLIDSYARDGQYNTMTVERRRAEDFDGQALRVVLPGA